MSADTVDTSKEMVERVTTDLLSRIERGHGGMLDAAVKMLRALLDDKDELLAGLAEAIEDRDKAERQRDALRKAAKKVVRSLRLRARSAAGLNDLERIIVQCEDQGTASDRPKEERVRLCKHWEPGQTFCKLHNLHCAAPDCFIYVSAPKEES